MHYLNLKKKKCCVLIHQYKKLFTLHMIYASSPYYDNNCDNDFVPAKVRLIVRYGVLQLARVRSLHSVSPVAV